MLDERRASDAGRACWPGRPAPAWPPARPRPPGTGWRGGRCRKQKGTIELDGLEGPVRVRRDRWGVPHIEAELPPTSGSPRASATARTGSGRWTSTAASSPGGSPRSPGEEGLPVDRLMRTLGHPAHGRARGGGARPRAARPARALLRRGQRGRRRAPRRCPSRCSCCGSTSSPGARSTSSASASCSPSASRPTGSGSCCAPTWCATLGPELAARLDPGYPADNPVVTQEAVVGRRPGARRADRRGAPLDRAGRRGERLQQLGGHAARSARPARR